jgi:GntR family transcriptional regulator
LLSQELGVSVGTVRKAMEKLMQERIVVRERGRGTFVRRDSCQQPISMLAIRDRDGSIVEPNKSPACYSATRVSGAAARALAPKLNANASLPVIKFECDWQVSGTPICHETLMIYQKTFLDSAEVNDLSGETLLARYLEQYRLQVHAVRWEIGAQPLLAASDALDRLPQPSIAITRHALNANAEQFEVCEFVISIASHLFEIIQ